MSTYDAEEEQIVEAIQGWWQKYGMISIIVFVLAIGGYLGWKAYNNGQLEKLGDVSAAYSTAMNDLSAKGLSEKENIQSFIDDNAGSSYATLAALSLAKYLIEDEQLDQGLTQLKWAQSNNNDEQMKPLIAYRMARVLTEQQQYQSAIDELNAITDEAWQARSQSLIGDIYLLQNDKESALNAYNKAKSASTQEGQAVEPLLQMKLDDLAQ